MGPVAMALRNATGLRGDAPGLAPNSIKHKRSSTEGFCYSTCTKGTAPGLEELVAAGHLWGCLPALQSAPHAQRCPRKRRGSPCLLMVFLSQQHHEKGCG